MDQKQKGLVEKLRKLLNQWGSVKLQSIYTLKVKNVLIRKNIVLDARSWVSKAWLIFVHLRLADLEHAGYTTEELYVNVFKKMRFLIWQGISWVLKQLVDRRFCPRWFFSKYFSDLDKICCCSVTKLCCVTLGSIVKLCM